MKKILLLGLCFLLMISMGVNGALTDGLVAYYKFENNLNDEKGLYNGTDAGTVHYSAGKINTAVEGDGTADYFLLNHNVLTKTTFTLGVWAKRDNTSSDDAVWGNWGEVGMLHYLTGTTNIQSYINTNIGTAGSSLAHGIDSTTWTYIVQSYNGTALRTYFNGNLVGNVAETGTIKTPVCDGNKLTILAYYNDPTCSVRTSWLDGRVDEMGWWNRALNSTEITELYNSGLGLTYPFLSTPTVSSVVMNTPIIAGINTSCNYTFTNSSGGSGGDLSNISYYIDDGVAGHPIYQWNFTGGLSNATLNSSYFTFDDWIKCSVTPYDNFGTWGTQVNSSLVSVNLFSSNVSTYNTPVLDGTLQDFSLVANFSNGEVVSIPSALFWFNGSNYSVTNHIYSNYLTLSTVDVPMPNLTSASVNKLWNFTIDVVGLTRNGTFVFSNTTNITFFGVDNCSTYTTKAINFTIKNESSGYWVTAGTGDLSVFLTAWLPNSTASKSYNLTWNANYTHGICISPNYATAYANAQAEYGATGFSTKTYYLSNYTLDNSTSNIDLYLTDGTTQVKFVVNDFNDDPISGVTIKVLSYDLGTNTSITTEILKTDNYGNAYGQIVLNTQWYKFIIEYNGQIYLETEPTKLTLTTYTFRINLESDYFEDYQTLVDTSTSLTYDNNTQDFTYVWSDSTGDVTEGCLEIVRRSVSGDLLINRTCVSSSAGSITASLPALPGSYTYIASSYVVIGATDFFMDSESVSLDNRHIVYGKGGLFFAALIILTASLWGLFSPSVAIAGSMVAVIFLLILGFLKLSWIAIVTLVILGGIALYRTNRR